MKVLFALAVTVVSSASFARQDVKESKNPPVQAETPVSAIVFVKRGVPGLWKRLPNGTVSRLTDKLDSYPNVFGGRIYFTRRLSSGDSGWSILPDGTDPRLLLPHGSRLTVRNSVWAWIEFSPTEKQPDGAPVWTFVVRSRFGQRILGPKRTGGSPLPANNIAIVKSGTYPFEPIFLDLEGQRVGVRVQSITRTSIAGQTPTSSSTSSFSCYDTASGRPAAFRKGNAKEIVSIASFKSRFGSGWLGLIDTEGGRMLCNLSAESDPTVLRPFPGATHLSVSTSGRLLVEENGKFYTSNGDGAGRTFLLDGSEAVWLD